MKKITFLSALALVLTMSLTGCKEDTQPRLDYPTEFQLNTPPFAHQEYIVDEGGYIEFTCSQADYGMGTTPQYQLEVAKPAEGVEDANLTWVPVEYTTTQAKMVIPAEPFSMAVCSAYGWDDPAMADEPVPVKVRCVSHILNAPADENGVSKYDITSNVITLDQVKVYFAVKLPDAIYLIGKPQGWNINDGSMPLYETEIGSRVYKGTYEIKEGEFQFRFYDEIGNWDWYSIGSQNEDATVAITLTDGEYTGPVFYDPATEKAGKGGWQVEGWSGGNVEMTVNLNSMTVVFKKVD